MQLADTMPAAGRSIRARDWCLVLLLVLAYKQALSCADASQLQWLLWPVASLLNATGTLGFHRLPSGDWLDAAHGVAIVKACAGGNFLVASWLGNLWCWRDRPFGLAVATRAAVAAWLTTLAANALRILLIAHGQHDFALLTGLSDDEAHRLIGVVVYFACLAVQMGGVIAVPAAVAVYLGVALLLPTVRALVLGRDLPNLAHAAWTAGVPLVVLVINALSARAVSREAFRSTRRESRRLMGLLGAIRPVAKEQES